MWTLPGTRSYPGRKRKEEVKKKTPQGVFFTTPRQLKDPETQSLFLNEGINLIEPPNY